MESVDGQDENDVASPLQAHAFSINSHSGDDLQASLSEAGHHDDNGPLDTSETLCGSTSHICMEQNEFALGHFHTAIINEDLAGIKSLQLAQAKMAQTIQELIHKRCYKSSDDGYDHRFRWTDDATFYLLKFCYDIGPFYGFESLKTCSSKKLEQSNLISLKWTCIWYDILMTLKFEDGRVPTELQPKTKCRYLLANAIPKLSVVTTGDERIPFSFTGVNKVDNMLEELCRLKLDAEARKVEVQKLDADQRNNKRTASQMLCPKGIPSIVQNKTFAESEVQSGIDGVNQFTSKRAQMRGVTPEVEESDLMTYSITKHTLYLCEKLAESIDRLFVENRNRKERSQQQKEREFALKQKEFELSIRMYEVRRKREEEKAKREEERLSEEERSKSEQFDHYAKRTETIMKLVATSKILENDYPASSEAIQNVLQKFSSRYS
ncbi:uncharacterized protein LALA0_S05e01134g [Lachancea lanzarotensis]|uniref:LALA0S05e01134g1_1 n=1 Tax=Lachancea lanzarotensis TaxID=1245769 RepID=A0A0C7N6S1_9SACH|nr:uncharacterized protein LALA0_S05e01134g [Lachancea lanzarotensis]CEP62245.1 LALA0S05e01134g1_1 [Lachancea lanzarotensis]